jgi:small subunit ribosomal protein S17
MPENKVPRRKMDGRGKRKELSGVVVNDKMDKTVKVLVERLSKHKKYKKYIRYRSHYLAHDPHNRCQKGMKVRLIESRPISKLKRWRILEIVE